MASAEFWELTWYDFGLWCLRIQELDKIRLREEELHLGIARSIMTMYHNAHLNRGDAPYSPTDFYVLSTDEIEDKPEQTEEEKEVRVAKMQERFKPREK
jgi:hypothetical protein